jgi:hypothetical protein
MSRKDRLTKAQIIDGFRLLELDSRLIEPYTNASEYVQDLIEKLHVSTGSESIETNTSDDIREVDTDA